MGRKGVKEVMQGEEEEEEEEEEEDCSCEIMKWWR